MSFFHDMGKQSGKSYKHNMVHILYAMSSEKVTVAKNKANITFQGQGYASTAIVWNDTANSSHGTFYSGSVQVFGSNFIAKNISFMVSISHIFLKNVLKILVLACLSIVHVRNQFNKKLS